jgi:hypothetical protein
MAASGDVTRPAASNQRNRAGKSGNSSVAAPSCTGWVFRKSSAVWLPRKKNLRFPSESCAAFLDMALNLYLEEIITPIKYLFIG